MTNKYKIFWTKTDEAPELATYSLLPIINAFTKQAAIKVELSDISLAGRIIANFSENLKDNQKIPDHLNELGELTLRPEANIIKLPNISATIPQLKEAIKELKDKGYNIPDYPEEPKTDAEKLIVERYAKLTGSAVNPVLREGNSDRRAAASVKKFAKLNPHKMMRPWGENSKTHVAHMTSGDFYGNEKSVVTTKSTGFKIVLTNENENIKILKDNLKSTDGEILDGTFMCKNKLIRFYEEQISDAREKGILWSLHLKATMMKVSDPILFGHAVSVYYNEVIDKHRTTFEKIGVNLNNGLGDLYKKIEHLPDPIRSEIEKDIHNVSNKKAKLAMVDSDKGITNLHVPNDIIIDASMPVVIRDGGKMWGPDGKLQDTKAVIPDRCYAGIYQEVIENCNLNGAFNPGTMGSVSNVGLMAQKAEEYGSHPTTFEIPFNGLVNVITDSGDILIQHKVEKGDIWRMSRVKDLPIQDWVKLAVNRAKATGNPTIFWLDKNRAHDLLVIEKVTAYLKNHDTTGLEIKILSPEEAIRFSLDRIRKGLDTISVTGNVLRDYLTDLFPIIELGTSARMLSIVPLLAGGGLFETGAGGSAPKHVQQFLSEGHLRWDSLGEFLAFTASLEMMGQNFNNEKAIVLSQTLDKAVETYLMNGKYPSRKAGELDNRGTHFFLAQYWAIALSEQNKDPELKEKFIPVAKYLIDNETIILKEIAEVEGKPTNTGGYYLPDDKLAEKAMRPSKTLNSLIDSLLISLN
jgi:isocitrate dehydrogenase